MRTSTQEVRATHALQSPGLNQDQPVLAPGVFLCCKHPWPLDCDLTERLQATFDSWTFTPQGKQESTLARRYFVGNTKDKDITLYRCVRQGLKSHCLLRQSNLTRDPLFIHDSWDVTKVNRIRGNARMSWQETKRARNYWFSRRFFKESSFQVALHAQWGVKNVRKHCCEAAYFLTSQSDTWLTSLSTAQELILT